MSLEEHGPRHVGTAAEVERWRGGVDEKLNVLRDDVQETKDTVKDVAKDLRALANTVSKFIIWGSVILFFATIGINIGVALVIKLVIGK